jgi:hypothetical protein
MSTNSETGFPRGLLDNHTYWCALPVRGGVCNCQSDHDPSTDPWPYLATLKRPQERSIRIPAARRLTTDSSSRPTSPDL